MASHDETNGEPAVRKVQFTGGSTYTVSLPKDWARDQDLSAGASLYLYSLEDRVVVAPAQRSEGERAVRIAAGDLEPAAVERRVRAAYVAGADAITVRAGDGHGGGDDGGPEDRELPTDVRRAARSVITSLVGMGVEREDESAIAVRCMLDATDVSPDQTLAQLRQRALSTHREAVAAVTEGDGDLAETIPDRVDDVDRLVALVARQFQAALVDVGEVDRLGVGRAAAYRRVAVARGLGGVAGQAPHIAAIAREQSSPPPEALADELDAVGSSARDLVRTALGETPDETFDAVRSHRDDVAALSTAVDESDDPDATRYARLVEVLGRTADHATDVARARLRVQGDDERED